jgi:hypothetical protein
MVERAILVVPFWPAQSWFSSLISILISLPVRLPQKMLEDQMTMTQNLESDNLSVKQTNLCQVQRNDYKFYQKFPFLTSIQ